jgi:hypothetical protein
MTTRRRRAIYATPRSLDFAHRAMLARTRIALSGYSLTQLLCQRQAWDGDSELEQLVDEVISNL